MVRDRILIRRQQSLGIHTACGEATKVWGGGRAGEGGATLLSFTEKFRMGHAVTLMSRPAGQLLGAHPHTIMQYAARTGAVVLFPPTGAEATVPCAFHSANGWPVRGLRAQSDELHGTVARGNARQALRSAFATELAAFAPSW